jgi:hypothetical protein
MRVAGVRWHGARAGAAQPLAAGHVAGRNAARGRPGVIAIARPIRP